MKERLGLTEIRKHANRMTFAEVCGFSFSFTFTLDLFIAELFGDQM